MKYSRKPETVEAIEVPIGCTMTLPDASNVIGGNWVVTREDGSMAGVAADDFAANYELASAEAAPPVEEPVAQ